MMCARPTIWKTWPRSSMSRAWSWTGPVWCGMRISRFMPSGCQHWSFRGNGWQHIRSAERQRYLKNAYRVLLTRARQGMVVVVPRGDREDPTRDPRYYDETFDYLSRCGIQTI